MKGGTDMMDVLDAGMLQVILDYKIASTFMALFFFIAVIVVIVVLLYPTKSKQYRRVLADLFVAGKIKKFAKEDDINLIEEEVNFNRWNKKERLRDFSLDNVVEVDLNERITESQIKEPKK